MIRQISKDQALFCINHQEFGNEIISSAKMVAVILTQSWCPQWLSMKGFIDALEGCEIFFLEYDLVDFFDRFRMFKENIFGNDEVPYIRYYRNGKVTTTSNAVSKSEFLKNLDLSDQ